MVLKNSYMASNLTSMNAEDTHTSSSAPQITSKNTGGILTKEMNLSLKISVIIPPRNIPCACYRCKITYVNFHNHLDDQRNYPAARLFCCHRLFSSDKIVQCTLLGPVYNAVLFQVLLQCTQDIFVYSDIRMVYSGICIDLENRYRLDSILFPDKCKLQYCIRLFIGYI